MDRSELSEVVPQTDYEKLFDLKVNYTEYLSSVGEESVSLSDGFFGFLLKSHFWQPHHKTLAHDLNLILNTFESKEVFEILKCFKINHFNRGKWNPNPNKQLSLPIKIAILLEERGVTPLKKATTGQKKKFKLSDLLEIPSSEKPYSLLEEKEKEKYLKRWQENQGERCRYGEPLISTDFAYIMNESFKQFDSMGNTLTSEQIKDLRTCIHNLNKVLRWDRIKPANPIPFKYINYSDPEE